MPLITNIDLNCDLGEGYNDEAIMPFISSCNIACGGHSGDTNSVEKAVLLAKENDVKVGAHPSYPDRASFGRKHIDISDKDLLHSIAEQVGLVTQICFKHSVPLHHIKLHGALYNEVAKNKKLATTIFSFFRKEYQQIKLYLLANSEAVNIAHKIGLNVDEEVFADRQYASAASLVSRSIDGASIIDIDLIKQQLDLFLTGQLRDCKNNIHKVNPNTICLHSDTVSSVELAEAIFDHLKQKNVSIS